MIELWFQSHNHTPIIRYDFFEQIWIVVERRQHILSNVYATLFLLKTLLCYRQQLLFRFFCYLINCSKTLSFHWCVKFWKEEKVSGGQVRRIRWLRHDYDFIFGQKLTQNINVCAGALSWCKIHD